MTDTERVYCAVRAEYLNIMKLISFDMYINQQDAQNSCTCGCCVVIAYTGIYQMRCTAYKVAPDDGLIQSETYRASNGK